MQTTLNSTRTNTMVKAAFLTGISIVLTRFFSIIIPIAGFPALRIGFGSIPIAISGILFGPLVGAGTGLAADLLGVLVLSQGQFHPGFMLSSVLEGLIPGIIFLIFRRTSKDNLISLNKVFFQELIVTVFVALLLNTLWLSQLFGESYLAFLPTRIFSSVVNLFLKTTITYNLLKKLYK